MIINYELPAEEEEIVYAGGIKGIRALRMQRDTINQHLDEDIEKEREKEKEERNKFSKYEEEEKR